MSESQRIPTFAPESIPVLNSIIDDLYRRIAILESDQTITMIVTVGINETEIRHPLGRVPREVSPLQKADATIWETRSPTATSIYLQASSTVDATLRIR